FGGAALLTATVVAFSGPIGSVGLIVPHMLRGFIGHDNRLLVPTALGGAGPVSVSGLGFTLAPGEVLGVSGPNSAGKTTLVRLLTRVVRPTAGAIFLDGEPLAD